MVRERIEIEQNNEQQWRVTMAVRSRTGARLAYRYGFENSRAQAEARAALWQSHRVERGLPALAIYVIER